MNIKKNSSILLLNILLFFSAKLLGQCALQPFYTNDLDRPYFSSANLNGSDMTSDSNGNIYTVFNDNGISPEIIVRKYNGSTWSTFGGGPVATSSNGFNYACIALNNIGNPYVAFADGSTGQLNVYAYNGTGWLPVGAINFSSAIGGNPSLALDANNIPYVAFNDVSLSNKLTVMKFDGTNWVTVGSAGFSAGGVNTPNIVFDKNNTPYVSYTDHANLNKATVMKFDGTTWNALGGVGFTSGGANGISLAINSSNKPYILYSDAGNSGKSTVQMFDGTSWQIIGTAGISAAATQASFNKIAINSLDVPYIAYSLNGVPKPISVMQYNGTSWVFVGASGFGNCSSISGGLGATYLGFDNTNTPYLGYTDQAYIGTAVVQKFNGASWQVLGTTGVTNTTSNYSDITVDQNGVAYVATTDPTDGNKLSVYKNVSGNWVLVGMKNFTPGAALNPDLEVSPSGYLYVAYRDGSVANKISVQKFDGSNWSVLGAVGLSLGSVSAFDLQLDKNKDPFIAYSDNGASYMVSVKKYTGSSWSLVGAASFVAANSAAGCMSMAFNSANEPYISYGDVNNSYLGVYKFSGGTWSSIPLTGISQIGISSPVITFDKNDNLFVAYVDLTTNSASVIKYTAGTWSYVGNNNILSSSGYNISSLSLIVDINTNLPTLSFFDNNTNKAAIWTYDGLNWSEKFGNIGSGLVSYAASVADNTGSVYLLLAESGLYVYKASLLGTSSTISSNSVCIGGSVYINATGGTNYNLSGPNLSSASSTSLSPVTLSDAGTYTMVVTETSCGRSVYTHSLTVNNLPSVTAITSSAAVCYSSSVTLSGGGASTYTWSGGTNNGVAFSPSVTSVYTVTGTDLNGCVNTATTSVQVISLPVITANATSTVVCSGTGVALNGGGASTYTWSNGVNNGMIFNPTVTDTYTVSGANANGCLNTASITITVNNLPSLSVSSSSNNICSGSSVTLSGIGAQTYTWTGGVQNGVSFSPLNTSTYTLTGSDINGCINSTTTIITVYQNPVINIQASASPICFGNSVSLSASGASSYLWNKGVINGVSFSPSVTDTYSVSGIDANGCVGTKSISIAVNPLPNITSINASSALCGNSNGSANASISGGLAPYRYSWSNGDTSISASNLAPGQYQLQVIDTRGCKTFSVVNINPSNGPVISVINTINVSCNGGNNGMISTNVTGGVQPYNILWSNGSNALSISNLVAGPYNITVTDTNDCAATMLFNITEASNITNTFSITSSQCASSTGAATANAAGGTAPYTYQWDNHAANQNTATAQNLAAGVYYLTITDANNCSYIDVATISNSATQLTGTIGSITAGSCGANQSGSAIMNASNGVGSYTYLWSNGTTKDTISHLQPGKYYCTITDANQCSYTQSVVIPSSIDGLQQNICLVTVDTNSMTNKIVWGKSITNTIKSYKIYRESSIQNVYTAIATVPYSALSEYTDPVANPSIHAWRYKITVLDSCDNETPYSAAHKTIHLSQNLGVGGEINLLWDQYEGFNYYTYYIWRHDQLTNWVLIDSLSTNYTSYTDFNPPSANSRYMIEIIPPSPCNSTYKLANNGNNEVLTTVVKSRSNIKTQRTALITTGFNQTKNNYSGNKIYPNPNTGLFTLTIKDDFNNKVNSIILYNTLGEVVLVKNITSGENKLNIPDTNSPGVYYLSINSVDGKVIDHQIIIKQ